MYEVFANYWAKKVDNPELGSHGSSIFLYGRQWLLIGYALIAIGSMVGYLPLKAKELGTTLFRASYIAITCYAFWGSVAYVAITNT